MKVAPCKFIEIGWRRSLQQRAASPPPCWRTRHGSTRFSACSFTMLQSRAAFRVLRVRCHRQPHSQEGLGPLRERMRQLAGLLSEADPQLAAHLTAIGVDVRANTSHGLLRPAACLCRVTRLACWYCCVGNSHRRGTRLTTLLVSEHLVDRACVPSLLLPCAGLRGHVPNDAAVPAARDELGRDIHVLGDAVGHGDAGGRTAAGALRGSAVHIPPGRTTAGATGTAF